MRAVAAWYCVLVAAVMIAWWTLDLRAGALRRPDRARSELLLHLAAEGITAVLLASGGLLLLGGHGEAVALVGLGALLYTVVASPGYFLARRETAPVVMFSVLAVLTVLALVVVAV